MLYVDDIIITGPSESSINDTKYYLHIQLKLRDLGDLKYFLGLKIIHLTQGITLNQRKYTLQLLEDTRFLTCKMKSIPMDPQKILDATMGDPIKDIFQYRCIIGRLLYLTLSHPDITFVVHKLSQFWASPKTSHLMAVHHLLQYLKSTPG